MIKLLSAALFFAVATTTFAQSVVHSATSGKPVSGKIPVTLNLEIPKGYHIYGPKAGSTGIATAVKVKGTDYKISSINYPKTKTITLGGEKFEVFEGTIQVNLMLSSAKKTSSKPLLLVTSQACNDRTCLPPSTVEVKVIEKKSKTKK